MLDAAQVNGTQFTVNGEAHQRVGVGVLEVRNVPEGLPSRTA